MNLGLAIEKKSVSGFHHQAHIINPIGGHIYYI